MTSEAIRGENDPAEIRIVVYKVFFPDESGERHAGAHSIHAIIVVMAKNTRTLRTGLFISSFSVQEVLISSPRIYLITVRRIST